MPALCSVSSVVGIGVPALVELCSVGTVDEGNIIYAQARIVSLCRYCMSKAWRICVWYTHTNNIKDEKVLLTTSVINRYFDKSVESNVLRIKSKVAYRSAGSVWNDHFRRITLFKHRPHRRRDFL